MVVEGDQRRPERLGEARHLAAHHAQRAQRVLGEGVLAREAGQAQQHVRRLRVAGRGGVVLELAGAARSVSPSEPA